MNQVNVGDRVKVIVNEDSKWIDKAEIGRTGTVVGLHSTPVWPVEVKFDKPLGKATQACYDHDDLKVIP